MIFQQYNIDRLQINIFLDNLHLFNVLILSITHLDQLIPSSDHNIIIRIIRNSYYTDINLRLRLAKGEVNCSMQIVYLLFLELHTLYFIHKEMLDNLVGIKSSYSNYEHIHFLTTVNLFLRQFIFFIKTKPLLK